MRFTTEALVIREMKIGESDRLVTLLTKEYGVIKAFAAGAKNIKSKKCAGTSLLTFSSFTILQKKDTYKIYEVTPIKIFFGVGSDIVRLSLSQYFCELSLSFCQKGEPCEELYRLILNSINFLMDNNKNPVLIKAVTELRMMSFSGYMPDLVACSDCAKFEDKIMYFDFNHGNIMCSECNKTGGYIIDTTILSAMRHIVYSKFKDLYSFDIPDKSSERLSDLTEKYLLHHADYSFSTLQFYKSIK